MGSITDTIKETIDYLAHRSEKVGLISVHLYRPFSAKYFFKALPKSVKRITVLDRTKEPGANGEPLYMDVRDLFYRKADAPLVIGGRYGLSSKDTTPAHILAVVDNMKMKEPKNGFTVSIVDDVTFLSLPLLPEVNIMPKGTFQGKFYGIGGDGTVGANKNSIKIIGETTNKYCQAYFAYDSKKTSGITISHLRFGDSPIRAPYLIGTPDFVACHVFPYIHQYDILKGLRKGGTFLLNSQWDVAETCKKLPNKIKKFLADNEISFYIIDAIKIAEEVGLGTTRTNTILQSSFFKISEVIPYDLAVREMKDANQKSYGRKGEKIVKMNNDAVDRGGELIKVKVDPAWSKLDPEADAPAADPKRPEFICNVVDVMNSQRGDNLPVSTFVGREDGAFPQGTSAYEKRGIAVNVPEWNPENCTQCNQCAYVCPHAAIRPFLANAEEKAGWKGATTLPAIPQKTFEGLEFRIQLSPLDCTGCGNCADICHGKKGATALTMKPLESQMAQKELWDYASANITYKDTYAQKDQNVKNSQFAQPLFEFSGACAGCGETPYIKLATQLFGDRMMIANATGCSSIYGGSAPSTPYCVNAKGQGPSWANSLFEDNAEYGFGMATGVHRMRERIARLMDEAMQQANCTDEVKAAFIAWKAADTAVESQKASAEVLRLLEGCEGGKYGKAIYDLRQYLVKKSIWVIGGDGWAYDIGYGGLDHVLASGENVNVLVLDTEVYSNTGGQASKSTPIGAIAKFAASGKRVRKKDLGMMAMSYGYVYVAQVAMGASNMQYLKALREAEAYNGPSLIIAYSPCINHGLSAGMGKSQEQMRLAVECGYWQMYRYNPMLEAEGKNPFQLDSKEPDWSKFQEFILSEVRYSSLKKQYPAEADELFRAAEENAKWRYNSYKRLAGAGAEAPASE